MCVRVNMNEFPNLINFEELCYFSKKNYAPFWKRTRFQKKKKKEKNVVLLCLCNISYLITYIYMYTYMNLLVPRFKVF